MKRSYLFLSAIAVSGLMVACSGGGSGEHAGEDHSNAEETAAPAEEPMAEAATWTVDGAASNVRWEGGTSGAQVYSHYGDIMISEGKVMTEGDKITGGSFVIDMTTIDPKDEGYSEEHPASDLVGHLSTADFFAVEENPTASFTIKSITDNTIVGDLTVRGKTNEETVTINGMEMSEDGSAMTATGTLVFDRQKYDVAWAHYLEDVILSDDISLEIRLVANKG